METSEIMCRHCRLCLKICESFKALEGIMKNFLDKLLPEINLAAVQEPVICINCAEVLKKCVDFKAMCFNARGKIISFVNNKSAIKLDQIDVSLSRNENGTGIQEDQDICGFCGNPPNKFSAKSFDVEEGDVVLKKMIKECLSGLDLCINKKPIICTSCYGSLEMYFRFVTNCLTIEEKIKKHCETLEISSRGQIKLSQILQVTINDVTSEADGNSTGIINVVGQHCEERTNADDRGIGKGRAVKLEQMSDDDIEHAKVQVEGETESFMDMNDQKFNIEQFTPKNMLACNEEGDCLGVIKTEETFCGENKIKEENLVEMEDQKCLLNEEIEIKTDDSDFYKFEDGVVSPHPEGNLSKSDIKHPLIKKHISKIRMHQCDCCSYQTKSTSHLKRHLLVNRNPSGYKCDSCSFQTKCKVSLKQHLLVHTDPSEVTMHKCDSCSFQTKRAASLKKHMLVHRNPSEVTMYRCDSCSFQTKYKFCLKQHLAVHSNPSEITMYKCDSCSFQTKRKDNLKEHSLGHKNSSEVTMYRCDSCSYQTKRKRDLKGHMLVHRNLSEVTMYKCDSCSWQTKRARSFKRHSLVHKDPSEVTMYKCDSCSLQTKYKSHLRDHLLMHRNPSELTVHKCGSCSFQTFYKNSFKKHLLVHKDPSEVTMYKCDSCSFQTKHKDSLKGHLLVHKDPSEVTMYKCDFCSLQTKRKGDLKHHILKYHKDSSKMTTLKRFIPHI